MSEVVLSREEQVEDAPEKKTEESTISSVQTTDEPEVPKPDANKTIPEKTEGDSKTNEREKTTGVKTVYTLQKYPVETTENHESLLPFTTVETMCLLDTYRKYADVLSTTSNKAVKQKIWTRILNAVNAVVSGEKNRTLSEVKRKWKSLLQQARADFIKFKNATDENEEYPEIGIYSETIWDICGSQIDLSDDSDFNKKLTQSSDDDNALHQVFRHADLPLKEKYVKRRAHSGASSQGGYHEVNSDEETQIVQPRKRFRRDMRRTHQNIRKIPIAEEESDSEDFGEIPEDAEIAEFQLSLMKSELKKQEQEKKKLIKEIEKLDVEKEKLLLKRQKIELEIAALRERLKPE